VVATEDIEALIELVGDFLLAETQIRIVIAEHYGLIDRQIGNSLNDVDVFVTKITDKKR
jgi:hypothetical protein